MSRENPSIDSLQEIVANGGVPKSRPRFGITFGRSSRNIQDRGVSEYQGEIKPIPRDKYLALFPDIASAYSKFNDAMPATSFQILLMGPLSQHLEQFTLSELEEMQFAWKQVGETSSTHYRQTHDNAFSEQQGIVYNLLRLRRDELILQEREYRKDPDGSGRLLVSEATEQIEFSLISQKKMWERMMKEGGEQGNFAGGFMNAYREGVVALDYALKERYNLLEFSIKFFNSTFLESLRSNLRSFSGEQKQEILSLLENLCNANPRNKDIRSVYETFQKAVKGKR